MEWIHDVSYFFGGALLVNTLPYLVSGIMGKPFQSPFAKPRGQGLALWQSQVRETDPKGGYRSRAMIRWYWWRTDDVCPST